MPRAETPLVLPPRPRSVAASRWLYEALRGAILEGRLAAGARLPTTREMARQYDLARGTVVAAFDSLKDEGYVHATVGSGTYVCCELPESLLVAPRAAAPGAPAKRAPRKLTAFARRLAPLSSYAGARAPAFRLGQPALEHFPTTLWAQVASRRLRLATPRQLLDCDPLGYEPLRRAIADYLVAARGVSCTWQQVAIVSGTLEALHLVTRLLVEPGERVAIEDPGYGGARLTIAAAGAKLVKVPVDDEGMVVSRIKEARLAFVTPAHQYPLGVSLSATRRLALLEWARKNNATIFEDDYDSEFRYCGPPMPAMQGLDRTGRVVFSGSFSKVLFPSLRLAYLVLPPDLVEPYSAAISVTTRHAPVLEQAIVADFIAAGHFGRHLRRMREIYAERHQALLGSARAALAGRLDVCEIEAGLQTVGWLKKGIDGGRVAARAAARGVEVKAIPPPDASGQHVLLLGFAAVDAREIRRGVGVLGELV